MLLLKLLSLFCVVGVVVFVHVIVVFVVYADVTHFCCLLLFSYCCF